MDNWGAEMLQFDSRIDFVFIPLHGLGYEMLRVGAPDRRGECRQCLLRNHPNVLEFW